MPCASRRHLGVGRLDRDAGLEPRDDAEIALVARRCAARWVSSGTHSSANSGNLNPGGITPITVCAMPFTRIV